MKTTNLLFKKRPSRTYPIFIVLFVMMVTLNGFSQTSKMKVAAEKGDPEAQFVLARAYFLGENAEQSFNNALKWSTASANQGYGPSQILLGYQYFEGLGTKQDYEKAATWFSNAVENPNELKRAGLPGKYYLSILSSYGLGIKKNEEYAVSLADGAADQNYPRAQHLLGMYYESGRGVPRDFKKAISNYRKAAEQGYAPAQTSLATMYFYQKGVQFDEGEVMKWYTLAAEQDNPVAQRNLGLISENGFKNNPKKDPKKAYYWYSKAAENGDSEAMFWMGDYMNNIRKNDAAKTWYEKAASLGNADAMQRLGEMYYPRMGKAVEEDLSKSIAWHQLAAKKDQPHSLMRLGSFYLNGKGFEKDDRKALEYFLKAYRQGYPIDDGDLYGLSKSSDPQVAATGRKLLTESKEFSANYARSAFKSKSELTSGEESVITGILLLSGLFILADHLAPSGRQAPPSPGLYSNFYNEQSIRQQREHIQLMQEVTLLPTY